MNLKKIFEDNYNAYAEINHLIGGKEVKENMPVMNEEKFIEVVSNLIKTNINNLEKKLLGEFGFNKDESGEMTVININNQVKIMKIIKSLNKGFNEH